MGRWLKEMAKVWGMGENKRQAQEASRDELEKGNWTICSLVSTRLCPRHYQRPPAGGRGSSKEGPAPTRSIGLQRVDYILRLLPVTIWEGSYLPNEAGTVTFSYLPNEEGTTMSLYLPKYEMVNDALAQARQTEKIIDCHMTIPRNIGAHIKKMAILLS
ncbi:hypothetical protein DTO006G1_1338 [Penicillium roqueforti]|nr:hypothetical protein DTO012A1_4390 [Penicillium roqueforti]KAI2763901.1 hypothetical protein DTO006G1_1338 [Penicillium roqueforti]